MRARECFSTTGLERLLRSLWEGDDRILEGRPKFVSWAIVS